MANESPEINDLIFKELIKRGYSLDGNTRIWNIADSKLWYLKPEQAQAFLDLESSEEYKKDVIDKEISLIHENVKEVVDKVGEEAVNVIDIGCGDGQKAELFLKNFDKKRVRYCPIDISSYMVEKALKRIGDLNKVEEVVEFQWNISDFENIQNISTLLRQGEYKRNVFLLLGNTLGNFEINELLYEIRSSMKGGDLLIIGNGLDNRNPEEMVRSYDTETVNKFSGHILTQLGLKPEDLQFGARFKNSRIEIFYTIKTKKEINFLGRTLQFNQGDQVIVMVSYKYQKRDFASFMNLYFDDVIVKTSEDQSYALAICRK